MSDPYLFPIFCLLVGVVGFEVFPDAKPYSAIHSACAILAAVGAVWLTLALCRRRSG